MHNWEIEKCGDQFSLWDGFELVGIFESRREAESAIHGWDKKLWPWTSLYDIERRAKA